VHVCVSPSFGGTRVAMSPVSGSSAVAASEKTPIMGAERTPPVVPRRLGRKGVGRPTHRGGANTSCLALLAAVSAMAAMFAVVTRLPPINPGAPAFSATASLSGARRALHKQSPSVASVPLHADARSLLGAVTYDKFVDDHGLGDPPIELVWQRPRRADGVAPRGIVFFAHGCHHHARDFFPKSKRCLTCLGLPEETKLVQKALKRGYVVAAVSSVGNCWSSESDAPRVAKALARVTKLNPDLSQRNQQTPPTFAFGVSSGGVFVAALPFFAKIDGVLAQVTGVGFPRDPRDGGRYFANPAALGAAMGESGDTDAAKGAHVAKDTDSKAPYPPFVFSHMSKDALVGALVDESVAFLRSAGIDTKVTELAPLVVDDNFFHRRIVRAADTEGDLGGGADTAGATTPVILVAESTEMVNELRAGGFLDSEGFLKNDPRISDWRSLAVLKRRAKKLGDSLTPNVSPIAEVLNVAFGAHEMSSEFFDEELKWLEERTFGEAKPKETANEEKAKEENLNLKAEPAAATTTTRAETQPEPAGVSETGNVRRASGTEEVRAVGTQDATGKSGIEARA
jgi:hypothetical protein